MFILLNACVYQGKEEVEGSLLDPGCPLQFSYSSSSSYIQVGKEEAKVSAKVI